MQNNDKDLQRVRLVLVNSILCSCNPAVVYYNTANQALKGFNLRHHDCLCFLQSLLIKYISLVVCRLTKLTEDIELTIIYQSSAFLSPVFILFLSYIVVLPCPVMHVLVFLFPFSVFIHPVFQLCLFVYFMIHFTSCRLLRLFVPVTGINKSPSLSSSNT